MKAKGEALIRKMLQKLCLHTRTDDLNNSEKMCGEAVASIRSNLGAFTSLLKSKTCFADMSEDQSMLSSFQRAGRTTAQNDLPGKEEGVVQF